MKELSKDSATWHEVEADCAGQRLDNYLTRLLKGVPRSHLYRIVRSGEVRVNSRRAGADYRLEAGDRLRIPPLRLPHRAKRAGVAEPKAYRERILYEDDALLVIDKPAGIAVHGGSGVSFGMIEQLRQAQAGQARLELVHRLDRDTSGVLMVAKKRAALRSLHEQLRSGRVRKYYLALVHGGWPARKQNVSLPLRKRVTAEGERRVSVHEAGMPSETVFKLKRSWAEYSLVEAELKTGRTHQIRVHLSHLGHPIAGDDKYGDFALNKALARLRLKRMFLHASRVMLAHPISGRELVIEAPLPSELQSFLDSLDARGSA